MSTKVDPIEKAISQNSIVLKLVASLQNLNNKHVLEVPLVFNGLTETDSSIMNLVTK